MTGLISREERRRALLVDHCGNCAAAREKGTPWPEVEDAHECCHGWFHCECCGGCPTCIAEGRVEVALDEWESALPTGQT